MKKFISLFSFLLFFILFFITDVSAADITLPPVPEVSEKNFEYITFYNGIDTNNDPIYFTRIFASDNSLNSGKAYIGGTNKIRFEILDDSTSFVEYVYKYDLSKNKWLQTASTTKPIDSYAVFSFETVLNSSVNIYANFESNEIFFQRPPATLEEILEVETMTTAEKIIQAMKIILLCGVGCLALLIGLRVLVKVFLMFHVK